MVKFSKEIRQEIIKKYNSRDENGKKIYTQTELANEYGTTREDITAIFGGFESCYDYRKHLAKKRGFETYTDYQKHLAKKRGFESRYDYQNYLWLKNINLESKVDE